MSVLCFLLGHRWSANFTKLAEPGVWRFCRRAECSILERVGDEEVPRVSTRIAKLQMRLAVHKPAFAPTVVELGPAEYAGIVNEGGPNAMIYGMKIQRREEPGIALVALPNRKIGRYEIVWPTRFEEDWG